MVESNHIILHEPMKTIKLYLYCANKLKPWNHIMLH